MLPGVDTTVQDGGIGVVRPSASFVSVVGCSTSGPLNVPTPCADISLLTGTFGEGSGVEMAARVINAGSPVLFTRADADVDGSHGTLRVTKVDDSTSAITIDATVPPVDDSQVVVEVLTGGTIGTAGITYRTSVDAGRSWSKTLKLGTANTLTVAGRVKLNFAAGTLEAGDTVEVTCVAPQAGSTSLVDAFAALRVSDIPVRRMVLASSPVDAAVGGATDEFCDAQAKRNRPLRWIGSTRMLDNTDLDDLQTRAEYFTAMEAISDAYSTVYGNVYAAECYQVSAISGREERRPAAFAAVGRQCSVAEQIDIADIDLGALTGTRVRGRDGNPDPLVYDAEVYGGDLDELGFATLRGWSGVAGGTFVNNPRILSPHGSDFRYMHRGLVMDLAHVTAYQELVHVVNKNLAVNKDGTIEENQAKRIEDRLTQKLKQVLLISDDPTKAVGKASGVIVVVDRTTNVTSSERLPVKVRVLPNGVAKFVDLDLGYEIQAAA